MSAPSLRLRLDALVAAIDVVDAQTSAAFGDRWR
jgi:hypothetical protein